MSVDLMKENGFTHPPQKARSRLFLAKNIMQTAQMIKRFLLRESQLYSMDQTVEDIVLYVNSDETESICFNQECTILLYGKALKSED